MFRHIFRSKKLILIIGDIAIFYIAIISSLYLRHNQYFSDLMLKDYLFYFTFILPAAVFIFYINDLYSFEKTKNGFSLFWAIIKSVIFLFLTLSAYFYFASSRVSPKTILFLFSITLTILLAFWRYAANSLLKVWGFKTNAIIVSSDIKDRALIKDINSHPEYNYSIKHFLNPENKEKIAKVLRNGRIQTIILGTNVYSFPREMKTFYQYRKQEQQFINIQEFYEKILQKIPLSAANEVYFWENIKEQKILYDLLKRILDIILSLALAIILAILSAPISLAIKFDNPGPVFYRQKRAGENGKVFTLIKFRSMIENAENIGAPWTAENDPRVTRVGKFIRKTRLDELPQTINILMGDMSFIGPRPEQPDLQNILTEKIPFYKERNLIKPGLTGWAQIKLRYPSIDDRTKRLQYDLYYIKNRSFSLDSLILLKTINIVLEGKGR